MCIFIGVSASPNRPVVKKKRASPQKRSTRKKQQSKVPVRLLVVLAGLLLILFSPLYYGLVLKGHAMRFLFPLRRPSLVAGVRIVFPGSWAGVQ